METQNIRTARVICLRSFKAAKICYQHLTHVNPHYRYNFYSIYLSCLHKNQESNFEYSANLERIVEELRATPKKGS